jgi:hypothetical protein
MLLKSYYIKLVFIATITLVIGIASADVFLIDAHISAPENYLNNEQIASGDHSEHKSKYPLSDEKQIPEDSEEDTRGSENEKEKEKELDDYVNSSESDIIKNFTRVNYFTTHNFLKKAHNIVHLIYIEVCNFRL